MYIYVYIYFFQLITFIQRSCRFLEVKKVHASISVGLFIHLVCFLI